MRRQKLTNNMITGSKRFLQKFFLMLMCFFPHIQYLAYDNLRAYSFLMALNTHGEFYCYQIAL